MSRNRKPFSMPIAVLFGGAAALCAQSTPALAQQDRCAKLASLKLDQVSIVNAATQPARSPVPGAKLPNMTGEPGAGPEVAGLPAFCRVIGSMHPETGSDIRFEVWLPHEGWDGRFTGANSGGLAGYINYNDLAAGIRAGQAVAGSNVGHDALPGDGAWAKGHPEKVTDYGWRGVHLTAVLGKKLTAAYYGRGPDRSYFIGCSNGGRQALIEASRFPEDYDGIVAGAPAVALTGVAMSMSNVVQAQMPAGAAIRPEQAQLLQSEVLKQCDAIDGQIDELIADPRQCKFDASKLACGVSESSQCFTPPQIKALERIHAGARDQSGRLVAFGFPPSGAEVGNPVPAFGWEKNILARFQAVSNAKTLSESVLTDLAQTAIATDATFDFNRDPPRLQAALGTLDAQPDLSKFFARGGKLIMWHGWADPILAPESALAFYEAALQKSGARAKDQLRLFMVPGVQHCVGGTGPDAIGQIGAPMPGEPPERSVGAAIQAWVESNRVPDSIVGRRGMIAMAMNPSAPERQRLICAYPKRAVLRSGADPDKAASYDCRSAEASTADRLEPGLQGQTMPDDLKTEKLQQPYSKGVRVVGHTDIWNRAGNLVLASVDRCAYISSGGVGGPLNQMLPGSAARDPAQEGVAVIDVSDPRAPKPVALLRDKGSIHAAETIHAVAAPDRKVLVAGAYAGGQPGASPDNAAWLDIYDVSDCTNPKLMNEYRWPENVHMVTVSPNGRRVYGTSIDPYGGKGGLLVLDITDMAKPRYLGKFGATRSDGTTYEFATHEVSLSPDERRIYAAVIGSTGNDLNLEFTSPPMSAERLGPHAGGIYIFDNSDIVDGRPNPQLRLISTVAHGGWHSVQQANINGVPHLVGAGEIGACPGAWPKIANIADEKKPYLVGEFKLQMNLKENCPAPGKLATATKGVIGDLGTATSHFNDVDSAVDTRLGLFPFMWAGLRIVDLQHPSKPVEVGYFKPGDACMSHVRYVPETGHIWFACLVSGFHVIELTPELRTTLGMPQRL